MVRQARIALLATFGLLAGCGPTLHGLRHDPDFTYERLIGGGMAVGGVVSLVHTMDDEPAFVALYANMLSRELADEYAYIVPSGRVRLALGELTQDQMLASFRLTGVLDDSTLATLNTQLATRYCVLARMEDDVTNHRIEESTVEEDKVTYEVTKYVADRTLAVEFTVYDLQRRVDVWSAMLRASRSNANTYKDPVEAQKTDESAIEAVAGAVADAILTSDREYPDAPELGQVAEAVFSAFADALPDPPKKKEEAQPGAWGP
jgi:hypothetical protein